MDRRYMQKAIALAKEAGEAGEVPVGAVIVKNGKIVATGRNTREEAQNALGHAEMAAITQACERLSSWRLDDCELYVTLEPCPMCAGAILNARIPTVVFGAFDPAAGSMESVVDLTTLPYGFRPEVYKGICEEECKDVLQRFFRHLREQHDKA